MVHLPELPEFEDAGTAKLICSEAIAFPLLAQGIDLAAAADVPLCKFAPGHMNVLRVTHPNLVWRVGRLRFDDARKEV